MRLTTLVRVSTALFGALLASGQVAPALAQSGAAPAASAPGASTPPPNTGSPAGAEPLPPDHPPVEQDASGMPSGAPSNRAGPSPGVPAGTIEVTLLDAQRKPLPNQDVQLNIVRQTIAEGEARETRSARTDAAGIARFAGLPTTSDHSYVVGVVRGPAQYSSGALQLKTDMGHSVTLHVFPVVTDIREALVGMRSIVAVEPRDDVFQFEMLFRLFNVGQVTWVPSDLLLELPPGAKGFTAPDAKSDVKFQADGERGVRLVGTISPGQHDASFRFQVPNDAESTASFRVPLPPHVADVRVVTHAGKGMELHVEGFDAAQPTQDGKGQRMLMTGREFRQGDQPLDALRITLSGLPTHGPGRWVAVALGALIAAAGIFVGARAPARPQELPEHELAGARELLIDELVGLEKARAAGQIGPSTYEGARRQILEALARLPDPKGPRVAPGDGTEPTVEATV